MHLSSVKIQCLIKSCNCLTCKQYIFWMSFVLLRVIVIAQNYKQQDLFEAFKSGILSRPGCQLLWVSEDLVYMFWGACFCDELYSLAKRALEAADVKVNKFIFALRANERNKAIGTAMNSIHNPWGLKKLKSRKKGVPHEKILTRKLAGIYTVCRKNSEGKKSGTSEYIRRKCPCNFFLSEVVHDLAWHPIYIM